MAGIYIHIPYCKVACHYCNFHFSTNRKTLNEFIKALLHEIELQQYYLQNETIETIYFGGGTPSVMAIHEIDAILNRLFNYFSLANNIEITLEANPDDVTEERITEWKQIGINRFSMGVQSFFEEDLKWMNRSHNAKAALNSLYWVSKAGFQNTNIDLIYGLPEMSLHRWKKNIETFLQFNLPHLSAYCLTVEPKTTLHKLVKSGNTTIADDSLANAHLELLIQILQEHGYEHYEISNFAKPNQYSKHNTAYWQGKKYLGLGPSAHSYNGYSRQWNIANNIKYINSLLKNNKLLFEEEKLTPANQFNELLMTSLRTQWGLSISLLKEKFPDEMLSIFEADIQPYLLSKHVIIDNGVLKLTHEGKFIADKILSDLMMV
jgi:oxygen-independent coproporphyrinogen-3 oxidase